MYIGFDYHRPFAYAQICSFFLRYWRNVTAWIGESFNYQVPEEVYDWLGAFAYEFFLEQAIVAVIIFITPLWNNNWEPVEFGSETFMYLWLMLVPWTILTAEHEITMFIDFGRDQMLQYFVLETFNNFFMFPYIDVFPIVVGLDAIYKWSMYEIFAMDGFRD